MISEETIKNIINEIIEDIQDRKGLDNEWENIDKNIQEEIKEEWFKIINKKLNQE